MRIVQNLHDSLEFDFYLESAEFDHNTIATRAYYLWEERQRRNVPGTSQDDWYVAILELVVEKMFGDLAEAMVNLEDRAASLEAQRLLEHQRASGSPIPYPMLLRPLPDITELFNTRSPSKPEPEDLN